MFVDFLYHLRAHGLGVGTTEWLTLMRALVGGHAQSSLSAFHVLARAILVHRESDFDRYDRAFAEFFEGVENLFDLDDELLNWLSNPVEPRVLTDEERAALQALDFDELQRRFAERLAEQKKRHDGGNRWIGTGGTSPFGNAGTHPTGIRVGGSAGGRSAVAVASERRFANLRTDRALDSRQLGVALRRLRRLARQDEAVELDLDETVAESARQMGEIELVFRPPRNNRVRLLLLVDVGGSMDPWAKLTEELFTAAHKATHFKSFRAFFFHNCVYGKVYRDIEQWEGTDTQQVLDDIDRDWLVLFVGDAYMHPWELTQPGGALHSRTGERESGAAWLKRFAERCPRTAWLNPENPRIWDAPSIRIVRSIFPMYPLTVDGLTEAVDVLRGAKPVPDLVPALW